MNKFLKTFAVVAFSLTASLASASVVKFSGSPSSTFADGTFSTNLSGIWSDGFYSTGGSNTQAYNGYGQTGETIFFTSAKRLELLTLQQSNGLKGVTVDLFDAVNTLIARQTVTFATSNAYVLTFNTNNVSKIVFNNIGGTNLYGDGRMAGWYNLSNVTYSANAAAVVPEPASLALLGLGLAGLGLARRRRK